MREIEVEMIITEQKKKIVKIELPTYRVRMVGDYSIIYTKINEDLSAIRITKNDYKAHGNEWGFEVEYKEKHIFDGSDRDYHLGRDIHSLSEQRFNEIVEELRQFLVSKLQLKLF